MEGAGLMTDLDSITKLQSALCEKYGSEFLPPDPALKLGLARQTLRSMPISGVRICPENGTSGWYIYGGDHSDAADFYSPLHHSHLSVELPMVIPYLALAPGFRFIIDDEGYEDVWYEPHDVSA
ncbi:hypothetical protein RBA41_33175 [Massilia sp. CCM 9210]|nr:hypothetical protein [Massilia sp. CCM 9210]